MDSSKFTLPFFRDPPGAGLFRLSEQTLAPYPDIGLSSIFFSPPIGRPSTVEQRTLIDGTVVESILPVPYVSPTAPREGSLGPLYAKLDFSLSLRMAALQIIAGIQESCFNQHAQWEQVLFQPDDYSR